MKSSIVLRSFSLIVLFMLPMGLYAQSGLIGMSQSQSVISSYNGLVSQREDLVESIDKLQGEMDVSSKSRARRLAKQVHALKRQLYALDRRISSYPRVLREPDYVDERAVDKEFEERLNRLIELRMEQSGDYGDEELDEHYLEYLNESGEVSNSVKSVVGSSGVRYRVMLLASRNGVAKSEFRYLDGARVLEQRVDGCGMVYYVGDFSDRIDAEVYCMQLQERDRMYKGAVVVALDE